MQINKLKLARPLVLAPMAGVSDLVFRVLCRQYGCALTVSEMVSAKGLLYHNKKTEALLKIDAAERPTAIQLFGSVPSELAEAAALVEASGADLIDFNMGCPVAKVVKNGEGAALMLRPKLAYEILALMVRRVRIPVTVKMRSGWDLDSINAAEIARAAEAAGVAAVAVHARTRQQFYTGRADWRVIREVKGAVKIPVVGNGDIFSAADGARMLEETGCDGLMVARGADGNPWLFQELAAVLAGKPVPPAPSLTERLQVAHGHLLRLIAAKGETTAVREMRRHICAYLKGQPQAAAYRARFQQLESEREFRALLAEYALANGSGLTQAAELGERI